MGLDDEPTIPALTMDFLHTYEWQQPYIFYLTRHFEVSFHLSTLMIDFGSVSDADNRDVDFSKIERSGSIHTLKGIKVRLSSFLLYLVHFLFIGQFDSNWR